MSKVLVDPAALEEAAKWLEVHSSSSGSAEAFAAEALREAIAQPAEVEGVVEMGSDAWMALHLLDRLSVDSSDELRVMQVEGIVKSMSAALSAVTAERDRLATENERLARDAKNDAIAYKAVIERQEELRAELDAIRAQRGEPVAEIVKCEPYEDGSTNPHNTVNWFGLNAENDLPAGTKLYATP